MIIVVWNETKKLYQLDIPADQLRDVSFLRDNDGNIFKFEDLTNGVANFGRAGNILDFKSKPIE